MSYICNIQILAGINLQCPFVKSVFGFQASLITMKEEDKGYKNFLKNYVKLIQEFLFLKNVKTDQLAIIINWLAYYQ